MLIEAFLVKVMEGLLGEQGGTSIEDNTVTDNCNFGVWIDKEV